MTFILSQETDSDFFLKVFYCFQSEKKQHDNGLALAYKQATSL